MLIEPMFVWDVPAWMDQAACQGLPAEWFFLEEDSPQWKAWGKAKAERALKGMEVCVSCPVLEECRDYAVRNPDFDYGVWGGLTSSQRKVWRRKLRTASGGRSPVTRSSG